MISSIITLAFLLCFFSIYIIGIKKKCNVGISFDNDDNSFLKAFWAIIIILVHISVSYQNIVQDSIGSFAYIGVTFFFMASAYGLKYGLDNKKDYLKKFFSNRVIKLIVPMLLVNLILLTIETIVLGHNAFSIKGFINGWVIRLLFMYIMFYLIYGLLFKNDRKKADISMLIVVLLYSFLGNIPFLESILSWNVEMLGFAFGILLYNNKKHPKNLIKSIVVLILSSLILGILYISFKNVFFIGSISYEIYLCHPAIIRIISKIIPSINSGLFIVLSIITSICFAYAVNRLYKKAQKVCKKEKAVSTI